MQFANKHQSNANNQTSGDLYKVKIYPSQHSRYVPAMNNSFCNVSQVAILDIDVMSSSGMQDFSH